MFRALLEKRVELVVQVQQKKTDVQEEQKVREPEVIMAEKKNEEEGQGLSKDESSEKEK